MCSTANRVTCPRFGSWRCDDEAVGGRRTAGRRGRLMRTSPSTPLDVRFWARVEKTPTCWYWRGCKCRRRYGALKFKGVDLRAHHVAWELAYGPVPAGSHVLHRCDVPLCVRPDHLFLGDQAANNADMRAKGRQSRKGGARGVAHWAAKLTPETVRLIRAEYAEQPRVHELARKYGVTPSAMHGVVHRRTWKEVI